MRLLRRRLRTDPGDEDTPEASTVTATAADVRAPTAVVVTVAVSTASGTVPAGTVQIAEVRQVVGQGTLSAGHAAVRLDPLPVGTHHLTVTYGGSPTVSRGSVPLTLRVLPAPAPVRARTTVQGRLLTGTDTLAGSSDVLVIKVRRKR